jgi:hemerythrin-like domain-containing protein
MKITDALLAEHMVFHNLFDHVEARVPRLKTLAEIKALAALTESVLESHSRTEDNLFIEPLEHCFEQIGQRETFHQEHHLIDDWLRKVQKAKTAAQARRYMLTAVAACRKHFDKEERIVFPMAERVLKARTLTALALTWMEQRRSVRH